MGVHEHKKHAPKKIRAAVLTVSSTRTVEEDESGHFIVKDLLEAGHDIVFHEVVPDDRKRISDALKKALFTSRAGAVVVTGGTGLSPDDVTIEAVSPLFDKELVAFGALFAMLSFKEIGSAAILSRATAGIVSGSVVFLIPGSIKACRLAVRDLILPELTHILKHAQPGH